MTTVLTQTKRERAGIVWQQVEDYYGYTPDALRGPDRHQAITDARQALMTALYYWAGLTMTEAGRELHRDHTTVISGVGALMRKLQPGGGHEARAGLGDALGHILGPCGWTPPERPQAKGYAEALTLLTALRQAVVGQELAAWRVDAGRPPLRQQRSGRQRERVRRAEMEARFWRTQARRAERGWGAV